MRWFLRIIRRRRILIIATVAFVTGGAFLAIENLTPLYMAEAKLVIEGDRTRIVNIDPVAGAIRPDEFTSQTQAAIIASWDLASQAVDKLNLTSSPLYNPALTKKAPTLLSDAGDYIAGLFRKSGALAWLPGWLASGPQSAKPLAPKAPGAVDPKVLQMQRLHEAVTNTFLEGLKVTPDNRSHVVVVRYVSSSPEMTALAVNTTLELYLKQQAAQNAAAAEGGATWLAQRAKELSERVLAAERKLEAFERTTGAIPVGNQSLYEQQLARLNDQLIQARLARAEAKAHYDQAQVLLKSPDRGASEAAVLGSPLIQALRQQETKLLRDIAEMRTQYRDSYPKLRDALAELGRLQEKIRNELGKIVQNVGNEYEIAKIRESKLAQETDRLQSMIDEQHQAEVTKAALETEVKTSRQLYETILSRLKEVRVDNQKPDQPQVRVISRATTPLSPYYPRRGLAMAGAFAGSALLGLVLAFFAEQLNKGFRTRSELEAATGLSVLGLVPLLGGRRRNAPPHTQALLAPNSIYGEAIRALRTSLLLARGEERPRVIMVTSSVPGEGKTSTALSLATATARAGHRTILVECDVLRPSLHKAMSCPQAPGLGEYLSKNASIDEVVRVDDLSGAHYIAAGGAVSHASDLLGTEALRTLVAALRETYELVVLDSPPVLAVSDALMLLRLVDETVFLVRWQKTSRDMVFAALRQIAEAGGFFGGLVLTQVDMRKHAQFEYGADGRKYYGAYSSYHSDAT